MRWLVIVVIVVVLALVGYRYFYPAEGQQVAEPAERAGEAAGSVDLGEEIGISVSDTVGALEGITDRASAEAALPGLQAVESRLEELNGSVENLSEEGREALASLLDDSLPQLRGLVSKVEAIEGAGEVVKPVLDGIMARLEAWAGQPA